MSDYPAGALKFEPTAKQVAIRTIHDFPGMQWCVATASAGARHASDEEVADWDDVVTVEPPVE